MIPQYHHTKLSVRKKLIAAYNNLERSARRDGDRTVGECVLGPCYRHTKPLSFSDIKQVRSEAR